MANNFPGKILVIHNRYQHYGGEDSVVASEIAMLQQQGHRVERYSRDNHEICGMGKLELFADTVWSRRSYRELQRVISQFQPDLIHCHNVFPLISASAYWAGAAMNIPIVQTIHNFRLACLQAMFLRDGQVCESCIGKIPWRGVMKKCYRGSFTASLVAASALQTHRILGTYERKIAGYIALNEFCRNKLVEMGLPGERIFVKPNFVTLSLDAQTRRDGNPLFVGRLSIEKGIDVLAEAAAALPDIQFDIIGSGPNATRFGELNNVNKLGSLPLDEVYARMRNAPFMIMPSIWYENMPRTLVEAYGCGTPVIASRLGPMEELIEENRSGLLFEVGSVEDLTRRLKWALDNSESMSEMGRYARQLYEDKYTEERNYADLINIYRRAGGCK